MRMYEVTKQRFLIGKIAVLELNNADTKKGPEQKSIYSGFAELLELFLQHP